MNVLMLTRYFPPEFGGAAIQATYLADELRKQGANIEFYVDNGSRKTAVDLYNGTKVYRDRTYADKGFLRNWIYYFKLFLFIARNPKYKILHFHSMNGIESIWFPFFRLMKRKIIFKLTLVGIDDPQSFRKRKMGFFICWALGFVDKFVAISKALFEKSTSAGIKKDKIVYIPNGVNVEKFNRIETLKKNVLKAKLGLSSFSKIFFSVGKIELRKGYDFLLNAWIKICDTFPASVLIIGGPGNVPENEYYLKLQNMIKENGLKNIIFLGQIDNVDEYMKISDAFLFCSLREGFGNVLIEAMSTGVPVVSRYLHGITDDIIIDPEIGRVVKEDSFEKYADEVISFIQNINQEKSLKASEKIRSKFDIKIISRQYTELYQALSI